MALSFAALVVAFCNPARSETDGIEDKGHALIEKNCARCHATGLSDESPHPEAPPFRELSLKYPVSYLEEALVEGLISGHRDMPEFVFSPTEAVAIIRYLRSIQDRGPAL
ncbi:cytochrome c [Fulvimarina sp. MAC8]|uniref:c-type cytochrome n=1 Tax=Fulvimarina sp. MAC8 TaxID=3162874 RepID=UPI0032EC04AE